MKATFVARLRPGGAFGCLFVNQRLALDPDLVPHSRRRSDLAASSPQHLENINREAWGPVDGPRTTPENQRGYLDWLAMQLNYVTRKDWYRVTRDDFLRYRGRWLLLLHGDSHFKALDALYSDHTFLPWLFAKSPHNAFSSRETRIKYVDWLKERVGMKENSELKFEHFLKNRGGRLVNSFGGSPRWVLESLQSDFDRKAKQIVDQGFWDSLSNQREHLEKVSSRLGVKAGDLSTWYKVGLAAYYAAGCRRLLNKYSGSPFRMLRTIYPEHDWEPWKFKRFSLGLTLDEEMVRKTVCYIEEKRGITRPEQWYGISEPVLRNLGVHSLVLRMGGLPRLLRIYRPDFSWDERSFIGTRHFGKKSFGACLQKLWASHEVIHDFDLGEGLTVSFFLPSVKLCFDSQDLSYYQGLAKEGTSNFSLQENPKKQRLASLQGLRIIFIPFWWDRRLDSLVATILELDPSLEATFDFFEWNDTEPIPTTKSLDFPL